MKSPLAAKMMFGMFMAYAIGTTKSLFGADPTITERSGIKKHHVGTRQVVFSGPGQHRMNRVGPKGKAAKKIARKASHVQGYYGKQRRGELTV